jgi:hypothetical protein
MASYSKLQLKKMQEQNLKKELDNLLRKAKKKHKNPLRYLNDLNFEKVNYTNIDCGTGYYQIAYILQEEWTFKNKDTQTSRQTFLRLLSQLIIKKVGYILEEEKWVIALQKITLYADKWVKNISDWKPKERNAHKLFSSLVRYLFAQYPVPLFMDEVWFEHDTYGIDWFIDLAQGKNIRNHDQLPLEMTNKMIHFFLQAPAHYTVNEALRKGQILGLGGDKKLAKSLIHTRLGKHIEKSEDAFWKSIVHFFIHCKGLDFKKINAIVEYAQCQKFGIDNLVPAENSDFSIKGRSPERLWELAQKKLNAKGRLLIYFKPFDIQELRVESTYKTTQSIYQIEPLLTSEKLEQEGEAMKHCVYSYLQNCVNQSSSIWSLNVIQENGLKKRMLTIEVNQNKEIVQARGKCNRRPEGKEKGLLMKWAKINDLKLSGSFNEY